MLQQREHNKKMFLSLSLTNTLLTHSNKDEMMPFEKNNIKHPKNNIKNKTKQKVMQQIDYRCFNHFHDNQTWK